MMKRTFVQSGIVLACCAIVAGAVLLILLALSSRRSLLAMARTSTLGGVLGCAATLTRC